VQKYLRQHQPNGRASGVELFEKRLEAAEGSPTVSIVSEKNEAAQYAAVKGVSIDSDVDSDTVEINAVAGSQTWIPVYADLPSSEYNIITDLPSSESGTFKFALSGDGKS